MKFTTKLDVEIDGRWIAEILEIPGALAYGKTKEEAILNVRTLVQNIIDETDMFKSSESSMDFWNNDIDDKTWNNV